MDATPGANLHDSKRRNSTSFKVCWSQLAARQPRLRDLERMAENDHQRNLDFWTGWHGIGTELRQLVGPQASTADKSLQSQEAFEVAYSHLFRRFWKGRP